MSTITPRPTMGLGQLGSPDLVFRNRKSRYTISGEFPSGKIPEMFVKFPRRPAINESYELEQSGTFDTVHCDCGESEELKPLYNLCAAVYKFTDGKADEITDVNSPEYLESIKELLGTAVVTMYDGCGVVLEKWTFGKVWPSSINFGDLDHSSSSETIVEITWRYGSCEHEITKVTYPEIYGFKTP